MAKDTSRFVCGECSAIHVKWVGRCTTCNAWGSLVEEAAPKKKASLGREKPAARPVGEVESEALPRVPTGIGELDRVLGGGAVPGGVVLVGGDPGVGKSTLLLQALGRIAAGGKTALYVSGEESASQTALRARRLGIDEKRLLVMAASELDDVESETRRTKPAALVIDSVQTVRESGLGTPAGTVTQLREVTARVCELAQREDVAVFLVGHVTKDGALAGPKVLEHLVDAVLAFEGERGHAFRALRVTKNRFGSATEVGLFEMTPEGMREVTRPSELFLSERPAHASGSVVGATSEGARSLLVEVQALVGPPGAGTPRRTANGVDGARLAMLLAVLARRAGVEVGSCDVFVNLAGGLRVEEPALDLSVALSVASSYRDRVFAADTIAFGEIGLAGEVRGVPRVGPRLAEARAMGFRRALVPASSAERLTAGEREGLEIIAVRTLEQAAEELDLSVPNARLPLRRRKLCAQVGTHATEVTGARARSLARSERAPSHRGALRRSRRYGWLVALALMLGAAPHAIAVEPRLANDIVAGEDFRIRVSAALALGKSRDASAREPLEKALANDPHPAVRAAAAAALGALGDPAAIPALRRAHESDGENAVRSSAKVALGKLGPAVRAKVLVKIGKMTNRSGVRGDSMASVLGQATRDRASKLSGVEVLSDDSDHLAIAAARKLPVLVIDGNVAHLKQSASGSAVQMAAKVEYVFRKEASLKATVSGAAAAEGAVDTLRDDKRVQNLQEAALVGAVESALKNPDGLLAAAK